MQIGYGRGSIAAPDFNIQVKELKKVGCRKIFKESAHDCHSGRPVLKSALEFANAGDVLVVSRLDHLGRSFKELLEAIGELQCRGIGLKSLREKIDTTVAGGDLVFRLFGVLAELQRDQDQESARAGLIGAARKRGSTGGRPKSLTEADHTAARNMLLNSDITVLEVAYELGVGVSTLYRAFPGGRAALLGSGRGVNGAQKVPLGRLNHLSQIDD